MTLTIHEYRQEIGSVCYNTAVQTGYKECMDLKNRVITCDLIL